MRGRGLSAARGTLWALLLGVFSLGGRCADCPPVKLPPAMTELRAKELDPSLTEGLGLSTTHIRGDCRVLTGDMAPMKKDACRVERGLACFEGRAPLLVLVLPVNTSLPQSEDCGGQYAVEDLDRRAVTQGVASDAGEIVFALPAGRYALYVSGDGRCASCGLADDRSVCLVDVPRGGIAVRDLVADEATH